MSVDWEKEYLKLRDNYWIGFTFGLLTGWGITMFTAAIITILLKP